MDKPISAGDFVVVVKPRLCCGHIGNAYGTFFVVAEITRIDGRCRKCGLDYVDDLASGAEHNNGFRIGRLKRIPPQEELDGKRDASGLDERPSLVDGDLANQRRIYSQWSKVV